MVLTRGRINRQGVVSFGDASLNVWEDSLPRCGLNEQKQFKTQVFKRIVQHLNRLGWTCIIPSDMVKQYGKSFARDHRYCVNGNLQADLSISGRCIELKMFQSINTPKRPDHGGRYESDKEKIMPYLLRLQMEKTRRRIRDYLCNVFTEYRFTPRQEKIGPDGITAAEWVKMDAENCWHYDKKIGRRRGEEIPYNNRSLEGLTVQHGRKVYFADRSGRVCTGTAYYNINNMWWVVSGRYGLRNLGSCQIYVICPLNLRKKRNQQRRETSLNKLLKAAIMAMDFERAIVFRNVLKQAGLAPQKVEG